MIVRGQRGVALLQALLLTMIVSLLALQLSLTAREQVTTARMLESRLEADLLAHSLEVEALFNLMTMEDRAPSFLGRWRSAAETVAGQQRMNIDSGVEVVVSDLSSRLPLRLPQHPLWQMTLEQAGMSRAAAEEFLVTLRDMQDEDQVSASMGTEAAITRVGVPYPNRFIQLPTEIERWMGDWFGWMPFILEIGHHYPLYEVNKGALTTTLGNAMALKPNGQVASMTRDSGQPSALIPQSSELVSRTSSTYWRVEVTVEQETVTRRASSDFLLQSLDEPPFLWVGRGI